MNMRHYLIADHQDGLDHWTDFWEFETLDELEFHLEGIKSEHSLSFYRVIYGVITEEMGEERTLPYLPQIWSK